VVWSWRPLGTFVALGPTIQVDSASIVRFGLFEADLARSVLSRQGIRIKIQEQPFRILTMLLQQNGEIVRRETTISVALAERYSR